MRTVILLLCAAAVWAAELPVTHVILYKNGIAYIRRAGEVRAGETARLEFKAGEMNDVLKSLTIGSEGGAVTRLRYDSSEPLDEKLSIFPFAIGEKQAVSALLDQLRGARIEVRYGQEAIAGVIVSAREIAGDVKNARREELTILLDSNEMRTVDIAGLTAMRFPDPQLQLQFKDYLSLVARNRSTDKRSVYIDSLDDKARKLFAGYVVPAPAWKSSYRLAFPETGEPSLEGWAIVDNTSGEDWTKVTLALVSGKPVSFVTNLYEPRYIERATAELPEEEAAAPQLHAGAMGVVGGIAGGSGSGIGSGRGAGMGPGDDARMFRAAPPPPPAPMKSAMLAESVVVASDVAATAQGREAGELFEYRFDTPVTVKKSESAMLPFLQQKIGARKLLIYNDGSEHPRNAAELTNSTGKTLDGGPITVFDGGAYGGEALVETVKAGDKRLISYAVDLGTRVSTAFDSSSETVRELHVRRGLLTSRSAQRQTRTYTVRNADAKAKTLVIEHAVMPQRKLVEPKPVETTSGAYRFEVKLAANATEKLPVIEEVVFERTYALVNSTPEFLASFIQNKELSQAARTQLEKISAQKREIARMGTEISAAEKQRDETTRDQQRLRENIASLNRVTGQQEQVQNYARQLTASETELAGLRDRIHELRKKKDAAETALNAAIEGLEF